MNAESSGYTEIAAQIMELQHYKPVESGLNSTCRIMLKYYYRRYFIALKTL
jgi:hypothetical protein